MNEVEVKARVKELAKLEKELSKLGIKFGTRIQQNDTVYSTGDWNFAEYTNGRNILRLRREDGKIMFTLKRPGKNELDSIEHEVAISDMEQMEKILGYLGYQEEVRVSKYRRRAKYKGLEICLDEVEDLGNFIELEKLTLEKNTEAIQEELFKILESWGINRADREQHGYDTLMALRKRA